jgi:hypothetical protein
MPAEFEFNVDLIFFLAENLQSGKYGTFFCNSEYERNQAKVKDRTISIWLEMYLRADSDFKNPYYSTTAKG